jgi:polyisoprenoid-binding protein YceI
MSQITYTLDPVHSSVHFSVRHMMVSNVRGEFTKVSGKVLFDPDHPADASVEASIDVASINTREPQRDAHLKSADFLDVEKFPTITFSSKQVTLHEGGAKITGDLTIHGVTHPITLDVEGSAQEVKDPWGNQRIGMSGTTKLSRKEFGLAWNTALETGGVLVGDEVKITIDVQAVRG